MVLHVPRISGHHFEFSACHFFFEETCGQPAAVSGQGPTRSTGKVHKVLFVRVFSGRFLIDDYSSSINLENGDLPN